MIGDFNGWDPRAHPMRAQRRRHLDAPRCPRRSRAASTSSTSSRSDGNYRADKADPFAFRCETPPRTGSVVWKLDYEWNDAEWMKSRARANALDAPWSIYEMHLGSWRRDPVGSAGGSSATGNSPRCWPST